MKEFIHRKHKPRVYPESNEIIVYLDYHSNVSDGGNDLILDFRLYKDLNLFLDSFPIIRERYTVGSYIRIAGFASEKRLMRGCYYALNVNLLKKAELQVVQNSYLFIAEFDFSDYKATEEITEELLESHGQLDPEGLLIRKRNEPVPTNYQLQLDKLQLYVANVNQANWNALRSDGYTIVQYDMGAKLDATSAEVEAIYQSHLPIVNQEAKAILVISHWDIDHIHCLCAMSQSDIQNTFSMIWCPDAIKSNTAHQIYKKLVAALGNSNVHCICPHPHQPYSDYHMYPLLQLNKYISLYIGEDRRNINRSGIVMFVNGNYASANYTGDCLLRQANEVLQNELSHGLSTTNHILIAPHHGGANNAKYRQYTIQQPIQNTQVCVSVGDGNMYGHPDKAMLSYLDFISKHNVKQTNLHGDILEVL